MLRGVYFVPISELGIPNAFLGTAAGLISFIGFFQMPYVHCVRQHHAGSPWYIWIPKYFLDLYWTSDFGSCIRIDTSKDD